MSKMKMIMNIQSLLLWHLLPSATTDCQKKEDQNHLVGLVAVLDYLNTVIPAHKRGAATSEDNLSGILNANLAFTMTYCKILVSAHS